MVTGQPVCLRFEKGRKPIAKRLDYGGSLCSATKHANQPLLWKFSRCTRLAPLLLPRNHYSSLGLDSFSRESRRSIKLVKPSRCQDGIAFERHINSWVGRFPRWWLVDHSPGTSLPCFLRFLLDGIHSTIFHRIPNRADAGQLCWQNQQPGVGRLNEKRGPATLNLSRSKLWKGRTHMFEKKTYTLTYPSTKFIRIPELWNAIPNRDINSSSWIRVYRNRTATILFAIVVIAA